MGALAALVWLLGTASSAAALTISPSGTYTASAGTTSLRLTSTGQALTCTSSSIAATISSNGVGTVPVGGARFAGCTNALLGSFTITQAAAWRVAVLLRTTGMLGRLVGWDVTMENIVIERPNGCRFRGDGDFNIGESYVGILPFVWLTSDDPMVLSSFVIASGPSLNCSPALVVDGLTMTYSANLRLSRNMTVSG